MLSLEPGRGGPWLAAGLAALGALAAYLKLSGVPRRLSALRAAGIAAAVLALLAPTLVLKRTVWKKPRLAILVQNSASMAAPARGRLSRLQAALGFLKDNEALIRARARPEFYSLSSSGAGLRGWSGLEKLRPELTDFRPPEALRDVSESLRGASRAWLLSDGRSGVPDAGPAAAGLFKKLGLSADVLAIGMPRSQGLRFAEAAPPDFAFLHHYFEVPFTLEAAGVQGRELSVSLLRREGGQWLLEERKTLRAGSPLEALKSSVGATASSLGRQEYRLEARTPDREGRTFAAAREFSVDAVRRKYRIMYLCGRPSFGYSFLRHFLKSDPRRELVSFVILRNPSSPAIAPDSELSLIPFPAQNIFVTDIMHFDLFILENFSAARFLIPGSYIESLRRFVTAGGALMVIGGENAFSQGGYQGGPLEEMLPVSLAGGTDFKDGPFAPETAGLSHPLLDLYGGAPESRRAWAALPRLEGYGLFAALKPGAQVLLSASESRLPDGSPMPVLAIRPYGRGRVMLLSTDSTWRWRLGVAGRPRYSDFYERFWSKAVAYLTGNLDVSLVKFAPLHEESMSFEPVRLKLRVFDAVFGPARGARVSVVWRGPSGKKKEVSAEETEPGVFSLSLTGIERGRNVLKARAFLKGRLWGEDSLSFDWKGPQAEEDRDPSWLRELASQTGGRFLDLGRGSPAAAAQLVKDLPKPVAEAEAARRWRPFSGPAWLVLTGALLGLEWLLRRLKGRP